MKFETKLASDIHRQSDDEINKWPLNVYYLHMVGIGQQIALLQLNRKSSQKAFASDNNTL